VFHVVSSLKKKRQKLYIFSSLYEKLIMNTFENGMIWISLVLLKS
jgi:hypothetical protein